MADFRIWSTIHHIGPAQFLVVVATVPDPFVPSNIPGAFVPDGNEASAWLTTDRQNVEEMLKHYLYVVGKTIKARGDRIVNVETSR